MSEDAQIRLDENSIKRILHLLDQLLQTDPGCVRPQPGVSGEAGKCVVDGAHFFTALKRFLQENDEPLSLLTMFSKMLELAAYVRSGGSKMMLYRLETGCRTVATDYFQDISHRLSIAISDSLGPQEQSGFIEYQKSTSSLMLALSKANSDDERLVGLHILEIDALLVEIGRRLDDELKSEWATTASRGSII